MQHAMFALKDQCVSGNWEGVLTIVKKFWRAAQYAKKDFASTAPDTDQRVMIELSTKYRERTAAARDLTSRAVLLLLDSPIENIEDDKAAFGALLHTLLSYKQWSWASLRVTAIAMDVSEPCGSALQLMEYAIAQSTRSKKTGSTLLHKIESGGVIARILYANLRLFTEEERIELLQASVMYNAYNVIPVVLKGGPDCVFYAAAELVPEALESGFIESAIVLLAESSISSRIEYTEVALRTHIPELRKLAKKHCRRTVSLPDIHTSFADLPASSSESGISSAPSSFSNMQAYSLNSSDSRIESMLRTLDPRRARMSQSTSLESMSTLLLE